MVRGGFELELPAAGYYPAGYLAEDNNIIVIRGSRNKTRPSPTVLAYHNDSFLYPSLDELRDCDFMVFSSDALLTAGRKVPSRFQLGPKNRRRKLELREKCPPTRTWDLS